MSTYVEQTGQNNATGASGSASNGNSLTQITVGPAALAQLMIYEAMTLYSEIIGMEAKQQQNMIQAQVQEAMGQYHETVSEGKAAYQSALWQAISIGGSAVGSLAITIGLQYGLNKGASAENEQLNAEMKPMSAIEKSLPQTPYGKVAGEGVTDVPSEKVQTLQDEFERGNYENAGENPETKEAVRRLKNSDNYDRWEENFRKTMDVKSRKGLEISQRQSTTANYVNVSSTTCSSVGQAGSQMASGLGQKAQAQHRAAAGLEGTLSNMAGSSAQEFNQAGSKAYDAEVQEVQILERIHQTNSVNG